MTDFPRSDSVPVKTVGETISDFVGIGDSRLPVEN
jgi:hypothetical protein